MTKEKRSIAITSVLIKVAIVLCAAALFLMPYAAKMYEQISFQRDNVTVPLLITFYVCAAFGFVILFVLNKLIKNIGSEKVFIDENVKLLKILSYCCFAIAVVTLIFARFRILVLLSPLQPLLSDLSSVLSRTASQKQYVSVKKMTLQFKEVLHCGNYCKP